MRLSQTMNSTGSSILGIITIMRSQVIIFGRTKGMFQNKISRVSLMKILW